VKNLAGRTPEETAAFHGQMESVKLFCLFKGDTSSTIGGSAFPVEKNLFLRKLGKGVKFRF
jgi:hypothetical protein